MSTQHTMTLSDGWQLALIEDSMLTHEITRFEQIGNRCIPASVPGDWPLDYVKAGLLNEPYFRDNYLKIRDYETYHVFYGIDFTWDDDLDGVFLRFEGIDTVADAFLNGKMIGHAENMYIPHEFCANGIRKGKNELMIHIKPVALEARKYPIGACRSILKYNYEGLVIRKAVHMFGWDICPRIVSSGLWRPVYVIRKKRARIEDASIFPIAIKDTELKCALSFDVEIGNDPVKPYEIEVEGVCGDSRFIIKESLWYVHGHSVFTIKNPKLWWPRGYGRADQYSITAILYKNGIEVDRLCFHQGLRTAELIHDDTVSADGSGDFCFVINRKRIFVKGTNWVPVDAFHSNDAERTEKILDLVWDVGCNAMRIWGGGVYESDAFYDWCDEKGIMLWQDFMMACGTYPHTERMCTQLREEAVSVVRRLRRHASICLWAGDNECDSAFSGGWFDTPQNPNSNVLTREVLPAVLREEDTGRPYLPSSPYISAKAYESGLSGSTPEQHLWGPRDYFKGHFYHDANAVFASEIGYHGCNSPASLYRFLGREQAWPIEGNQQYLYHAASPETNPAAPYNYRIALMTSQLRYLFTEEPNNLDEYARMSQISQAEAKKYFIESFRCRKGKRTGLMWWNIMDCWPQISDAVVDYYFVRKLAYFYIRRSQQPICLMIDAHTGILTLYGVNDLLEDRNISYEVRDVSCGEMVASGFACLTADASSVLCTIPNDGEKRFYSISWTDDHENKGSNHYLLGTPKFDYSWYLSCLRKMGYEEFEGFDN